MFLVHWKDLTVWSSFCEDEGEDRNDPKDEGDFTIFGPNSCIWETQDLISFEDGLGEEGVKFEELLMEVVEKLFLFLSLLMILEEG